MQIYFQRTLNGLRIKALKDAWRTSNHTMFIVIIMLRNYDQNLRTCLCESFVKVNFILVSFALVNVSSPCTLAVLVES